MTKKTTTEVALVVLIVTAMIFGGLFWYAGKENLDMENVELSSVLHQDKNQDDHINSENLSTSKFLDDERSTDWNSINFDKCGEKDNYDKDAIHG